MFVVVLDGVVDLFECCELLVWVDWVYDFFLFIDDVYGVVEFDFFVSFIGIRIIGVDLYKFYFFNDVVLLICWFLILCG